MSDMEKRVPRKWRLWPAFAMGFALCLLGFVTSNLSDGGADLSFWFRNGRPGQVAGYLFGQLLALPIFLVVIVIIRNLFVRSPRKPPA